MLIPVYTNTFSKDIKRAKKRHKNLDKLKLIIETLLKEYKLPTSARDHKLVGNYKGRRECHVEPDWLLIYLITKDSIIFERCGSHADLFSE